MPLYVKTGQRVAAGEVVGAVCPRCGGPAGLIGAGETTSSSSHAKTCGLFLHAFLVASGVYELLVTTPAGRKVLERPNLEAGTVELFLAPLPPESAPCPGPGHRVSSDDSVGMDVVWLTR